jgi:hypothetical protein
MIARIHLLRRRGVLVARTPAAVTWSEEGYLETTVDRGRHYPGRRLVLRALQSAPGCGILAQLFRPALISIQHEVIHVRGLEPLDTADGVAAVVQEWLVRPRT